MITTDNFPGRLLSVDEAPEIFHGALLEHLVGQADLMLYHSAIESADVHIPASVLAVTSSGWLALVDDAGGHVKACRASFADTLLGDTIGSIAMWTLLLLGLFVWPGLLMWAVIVFFIAGRDTPPLEDLTPLTPARRWLGYAAFAILAMILAPLPHELWSAAGIQCPYL